MCYKVATPEEKKLQEFMKKQGMTVDNYRHYAEANGFENPLLPVTTSEDPKKVQTAMWKLIPHWVKSAADAKKYANTLNARCEEVFEKASYRSYIGTYRCLLWVDGFYEPHHPAPKVTVPYYVTAADDSLLTLGGVYHNWLNHDTGEVIPTFSIITTPPNELLRHIHNDGQRMPLVLNDTDRWRWLQPLSREEITELMKPLPDGLLTGTPTIKYIPEPQQPKPGLLF